MTVFPSEGFLSVLSLFKQNNVSFVLGHSLRQKHQQTSKRTIYKFLFRFFVKNNLLWLSKNVTAACERRYKVNNF